VPGAAGLEAVRRRGARSRAHPGLQEAPGTIPHRVERAPESLERKGVREERRDVEPSRDDGLDCGPHALHVNGRIALVDGAGPFGNPTSDSARTMVTTETTRGLLVVFAPHEVDAARLTHVMDVTSERMQQYTGCRETTRLVSG